MPVTIALLPLPGKSQILEGKYGLEMSVVRGIIRIHYRNELQILDLSMFVAGSQTSSFWDSIQTFDEVKRHKQLFLESLSLLSNVLLPSVSSGFIDIPFELPFPLHEPISHGFGPCKELLPNSGCITGKSTYHDYKAFTQYTLSATLSIPSSIPLLSSKIRCHLSLNPFLVYDPRLMPLLLHSEERRWKSHIGAEPIEYDIEVGSGVFGPLDKFIFSYRMLVNGNYARMGVRIRKVTFTLKETQTVGEERCCAQDDVRDNWRHSKPMRVRGTREILKFTQIEYPPPVNNWLAIDTSRYYGRSGKHDGLASNGEYPGQDGIYVERATELQIPSLENFHPSTSNFTYPPDDHICKYVRPRGAYLNVRHSIVVLIEMRGADSIAIEAGCYISSIGRADCNRLLETDAAIVPTLDYNKVTGGIEVWVPQYEATASFPGPRNHSSVVTATRTTTLAIPESMFENQKKSRTADMSNHFSTSKKEIEEQSDSSIDEIDGDSVDDIGSQMVEPNMSRLQSVAGTPSRDFDICEAHSYPPPSYREDPTAPSSNQSDPNLEPRLQTSSPAFENGLDSLGGDSEDLLDLVTRQRTGSAFIATSGFVDGVSEGSREVEDDLVNALSIALNDDLFS